MQSQVDVSVIIVNYNTRQMTSECIESVFEKTRDLIFEIILVDNGSKDGSKEFFEKDKRIKYIYSDENHGFGRANNLGYKYAKGKYIFFLNSDTLFIENSIKILFDFLIQHTQYVACGCQLLYLDGRFQESRINFPCLLNDIKEIVPAKLRTNQIDDRKYIIDKLSDEIDSINGADIFIRKKIFESIRGFDIDYFMYFEETDLFYRIKKSSLKIAIIPNTKIIHINGGSFSKVSLSKYLMMYQSKLLFYKKHKSKGYSLLAKIVLSISALLRIKVFRVEIFRAFSIIWK